LEELRRVLPESFDVAVTDGDEESWHSLELRHTDGELVALIERKLAEEGSAIQEFTPHLNNAIAVRATEWLKHYLSHVRTIYTLEPMQAVNVPDGWLALQMAQAYIWKKFGGILQADGEGFTNREGQHILWQFEGQQTGELESAVMDDSGRWVPFTMDMDDPEQVESFRRGEIPQGARRIA